MSVTRTPTRPPIGPPIYPPTNLPVYRGGSSGSAPAPSCAITLTAAGLGPFGLVAFPSIAGQTVSVTADGSSNYGVSSGLAGVTVDWLDKRIAEFEILSFDASDTTQEPVFQIARTSNFDNVTAVWDQATSQWRFTHSPTSGSYGLIRIAGAVTDKIAIAIDGSTGDAFILQNGATVVTSATTATSGTFAGLAGMFAGDNAVILTQLRGAAASTAYSARVTTNGADMQAAYVDATLNDWCGQDTVPDFDPMTLSGLVAAFDRSRLDTMFLTASGDTNITTAADAVGLALDLSQGLALGVELLPDSFETGTWSVIGTGVTLDASGLTFTASSTGSVGANISAASGSPYEADKSFEVTITIDSVSSGGIRVWTGSGYTQLFTSPGEYTFYTVTPADQTLRVYGSPSVSNTLFVSNISVKEVAGAHAKQTTAAARPLYQTGPSRLAFDGLDDTHVMGFATAPGSDCTVCRADPSTGASILTAQTIGTSYSITASDAGLYIFNRALTAGETASMEAFLDALAGV